MSTPTPVPLSVSIQEFSPVHVACLEYKPSAEQADMHDQIAECFQRVQKWVTEHGYSARTLTVGVINLVDGRLASYDCCVQVPEQVSSGSEGIGVKELPGGRYAVVSIEKESSIIGDSIGRFYQEYVPQNHVEIDGARPVLEIYYEKTMEYCVPVR